MTRITDSDLNSLFLRLHVHGDQCLGAYEPCGEHHRHDEHCGAYRRICGKPEDQAMFLAITELRERRARDRSLAEKAVQEAVDGVLGEMARQMGGPDPETDQLFKEARGCGLSAAKMWINQIDKTSSWPKEPAHVDR